MQEQPTNNRFYSTLEKMTLTTKQFTPLVFQ